MRSRIILLGPPGSGKGTQAERIKEKLGIPILGTGDLLRSEIEEETELGRKAEEYVDAGRLVPDDLIIEMMRKRMSEPDAGKGFILDGFPRTVSQAEGLDRILEKLDVRIEGVVEIVVDEEEIVARLGSRRICEADGRVYNLRAHPPKQEGVCDACGGKLITRSDDQPDTIRDRLEVYRTSTAPLTGYYEERGLLRRVRGVGSLDEIQGRITEALSD